MLIFHRVDFSHFILLLSKYWILSIINQALSKTKELPEIESRYFASEEEFPSLLASRQFIKAVILTDVCRYRFYAIQFLSLGPTVEMSLGPKPPEAPPIAFTLGW